MDTVLVHLYSVWRVLLQIRICWLLADIFADDAVIADVQSLDVQMGRPQKADVGHVVGIVEQVVQNYCIC